MPRPYAHLSVSERRKIARWRQAKLSPDDMARRLGRHRRRRGRGERRSQAHKFADELSIKHRPWI